MMLERWDADEIYVNKGKVLNKIQQVNSLMETLQAQGEKEELVCMKVPAHYDEGKREAKEGDGEGIVEKVE